MLPGAVSKHSPLRCNRFCSAGRWKWSEDVVQVERLTVEEGRLGGLDIEFLPGLNVLIGERGTGKTSVIELLRFALGAGWFTEDARTRGHQQALAVLGDGKVYVTEVVEAVRISNGERGLSAI